MFQRGIRESRGSTTMLPTPALTEAVEIWANQALEGRRKTTLHDYEQAKIAILQDIERRGIPAARVKELRLGRRPGVAYESA